MILQEPNHNSFEWPVPAEPSISLRDWLAGQALVGLIAHPKVPNNAADVARYAWEQADAMLAQREKQP